MRIQTKSSKSAAMGNARKNISQTRKWGIHGGYIQIKNVERRNPRKSSISAGNEDPWQDISKIKTRKMMNSQKCPKSLEKRKPWKGI